MGQETYIDFDLYGIHVTVSWVATQDNAMESSVTVRTAETMTQWTPFTTVKITHVKRLEDSAATVSPMTRRLHKAVPRWYSRRYCLYSYIIYIQV